MAFWVPASVTPHLGGLRYRQALSPPWFTTHSCPNHNLVVGALDPCGNWVLSCPAHVTATLLSSDTDTSHPTQPLPEPQPLKPGSASLPLHSSFRRERLFWVRNGAGRKNFIQAIKESLHFSWLTSCSQIECKKLLAEHFHSCTWHEQWEYLFCPGGLHLPLIFVLLKV